MKNYNSFSWLSEGEGSDEEAHFKSATHLNYLLTMYMLKLVVNI